MINGKAIVKGLKPYLDRETGEEKTPATITIYPKEGSDFVAMAGLHNKTVYIVPADTFEALSQDKGWLLPETTRQALKTLHMQILDLLEERK